jgi:Rrf2 family iron-sulfur cluster assembly transcriptional regulator
LRRADLVTAVRGPGGGYRLRKPAGETHVADIIRAVDEPIKATRCRGVNAKGCLGSQGRCLTHDLWDGLGMQIESYLASVSLEDIVARRVRERAQHLVSMEAA